MAFQRPHRALPSRPKVEGQMGNCSSGVCDCPDPSALSLLTLFGAWLWARLVC